MERCPLIEHQEVFPGARLGEAECPEGRQLESTRRVGSPSEARTKISSVRERGIFPFRVPNKIDQKSYNALISYLIEITCNTLIFSVYTENVFRNCLDIPEIIDNYHRKY